MFNNLTSETAQLIGMHVGDGTLYKTKSTIVWELRGSLNEKEYYTNHISLLLNRIFGIIFTPKFRSGGKNGCFGIQTTNKVLTQFFLDAGFNPGRKTHTVRIPNYIKNSHDEIKLEFICGVFDTDGCLRFERKNGHNEYNYPKIEFSTVSKDLHEDLFIMLIDLGFEPYRWHSNDYKICLAGKRSLEKFISEVAPKNKKHLNKYLFWKMHGFRNPDAAVA